MIENTTEYNKTNLKVFINYTLKKSRITCYVSLVIVLLCSIFNFIFAPEEWILFLFLIAIVVLSSTLVLILPILYIKKAQKMPSLMNKYEFLPDKFIITNYSAGKQLTKMECSYIQIVKVAEIKGVLMLYLNKNQALLVDCDKFKDVNDKEIVKQYIKQNSVSCETK